MPTVDISQALTIPGWMSEEELRWLARMALDCEVIIEVGCFLGRTTVALGAHVKGKVYAVDPWEPTWMDEVWSPDPAAYDLILQHPEPYYEFMVNTKDLRASGKVNVHRGTIGDLQWPHPKADLIFIDGSHLYHRVYSDIWQGMLRLNPRGWIAGHDYDCPLWPGVRKAVNEMFADIGRPAGSIWSVQV